MPLTPAGTPLSRRSLELRVGRRLALQKKAIARLRHHSSIVLGGLPSSVGQYAIIDVARGTVVEYGDLEPIARRLGALRPGETTTTRTAADVTR